MTNKAIMRIPVQHYPLLAKAVEIYQIKAALDGKPARVVDCQNVLEELKAEMIGTLPDKMFAVACHMTLEELTDLETALLLYLTRHEGGFGMQGAINGRMEKLLERVKTTIKLNKTR